MQLISVERGRCGVLRAYQHPRLGRLEVVTLPGKNGSADVIHIEHVKHIVRRQREAKSGGKQQQA